jgi:hypothetical protein
MPPISRTAKARQHTDRIAIGGRRFLKPNRVGDVFQLNANYGENVSPKE